MSKQMIRKQMYFTRTANQELKKIAANKKMAVAEVVRRLISHGIETGLIHQLIQNTEGKTKK